MTLIFQIVEHTVAIAVSCFKTPGSALILTTNEIENTQDKLLI